MLKVLLGAAIVIGLVGYGVIDTRDVEKAGSYVKDGVNATASWVKDKTEPDLMDKVKDKLND